MADDKQTAPPSYKGRFEVSRETFEETTKERGADLQELELKDALPDVFAHTKQIPRLVEKVWRKASDDILINNRGIYSLKPGTLTVQYYFYKLDPGVAKIKVSLIKSRMPALLSTAMTDEKVLDAPPIPEKEIISDQKEATNVAKQRIAKLETEGLGVNPTLEFLHLWAARTAQNMVVNASSKIPLTRDMMDVVSKSDISYLPLWSPVNQAIVGSYARFTSPLASSQYNTGEVLRQDLAMLFNAVFHLYSMQSRGQAALIIINTSLTMLQDKVVGEMYLGLLRRLNPDARKNLIIEFRNVPKDSVPPHMVSTIEALNQLVRAVIFETSLLTYRDYNKNVPKLHACGIDSSEATFDENDQSRFIKKYAEYYSKIGLKTYVKNVTSLQIFKTAVESNITYISGPRIRPSRKDYFTAEKVPLAEIK